MREQRSIQDLEFEIWEDEIALVEIWVGEGRFKFKLRRRTILRPRIPLLASGTGLESRS